MDRIASGLPGRLAFALALAVICLPFLAWAGEVEVSGPGSALGVTRHAAQACDLVRPELRPAVQDGIVERDG